MIITNRSNTQQYDGRNAGYLLVRFKARLFANPVGGEVADLAMTETICQKPEAVHLKLKLLTFDIKHTQNCMYFFTGTLHRTL